jgi:ribosomal protein S18 acetylase RimI-like enzyme
MGNSPTYIKSTIINILSQSFADNRSVNYIIKQGKYKQKRIEELMDYSYKLSCEFGKAYVSPDKKSCALIMYPDKKRTTVKTILWDIRFILMAIGIGNIKKALHREAIIKEQHPKIPFTYLWFIGTEPSGQGKGIGTALMKQIISDSGKQHRPIILETSTLKNIPWYEKFGFKIYKELDFGYKLYCMKLE